VVDYQPREGELVEIQSRHKKAAEQAAAKKQWLGMLTWIARERDYSRGWVSNQFREKFRHWPPYGHVEPIEPTSEVRAWVRSRMIAWAKGQQREVTAH
jgi:DNA repair protein RadD